MKNVTLEFNDQEVFVIGKALGMLPFNEVNSLIANIQKQIDEQNAPKAEAPADNVVSIQE